MMNNDKTCLNHIPSDLDFTDNTCNHKCSCCGSCCTCMLPITKKELSVLMDYIRKNNISPSFLSDYDVGTIHAFCPLLDPDTNKCKVYPVRPFVCRSFKCDKNKDTLKKERALYAKRADFNGFDDMKKPIASMQFLLFGDVQFDIQYRHLLFKYAIEQDPSLKLRVGELTFEKEQLLMPMIADLYVKKGGK